MQISQFKTEAEEFLVRLNEQLKKHEIMLAEHWQIDHICYRTSTLESYHEKCKSFLKFANLLIESDVNGRPISTFKLHEPIRFMNRQTDVVELPAPKSTKPQKDGFEHVEVVCDLPFTKLMKVFAHVQFNTDGLKKRFNQELEMPLDDCAIKFHHISLESVITVEKNKALFKALQSSQVLEVLHEYSPLIAGTFPLDLTVNSSDVDILVKAEHFAPLNKTSC